MVCLFNVGRNALDLLSSNNQFKLVFLHQGCVMFISSYSLQFRQETVHNALINDMYPQSLVRLPYLTTYKLKFS